jgi:hypothetical protein
MTGEHAAPLHDRARLMAQYMGFRELLNPTFGVDHLDFLMLVSYGHGAHSLIEYVCEDEPELPTHRARGAIIELADRAGLPLFVVRHSEDYSQWTPTPMNARAKGFLPESRTMTLREYAELLHAVRGKPLPEGIFDEDGRLCSQQPNRPR